MGICATKKRVAGIGMNSRAGADDIRAALGVAGPVDAVACLPARQAALAGLGLPVVAVADVAGVVTPAQSARVMARFGTGCVAEALALRGAGRGARLVLGRQVVAGCVTVAVAEGEG